MFMTTFHNFVGGTMKLREILDLYLELRNHFQEMGFTEEDLEKPKIYTDQMMNSRFNIVAGLDHLFKQVNDYGFKVERDKFNRYIGSLFQKINDVTPLSDGNNERRD